MATVAEFVSGLLEAKKSKSDKSGATSGNSDVRSPTSTDVRSPTSTKTSTDAYTAGNVTITGGAGSGDTAVHITLAPDNTKYAVKGRNITPDQKRAEMGIDNEGDPSAMKAKLGKEPSSANKKEATVAEFVNMLLSESETSRCQCSDRACRIHNDNYMDACSNRRQGNNTLCEPCKQNKK
jgi:hypothetical protein